MANVAALPAIGNTLGDARVTEATTAIYLWTGSTWAPASAMAADSFTIWQPDVGTAPTASSANDVMDVTSSDGSVIITGDASTKTLDFQVSPTGAFMTKAVYDTQNQDTDIFNYATAVAIALG